MHASHQRDRLLRARGFTDDLYVGTSAEHRPESRAYDGVIVDHDDANHVRPHRPTSSKRLPRAVITWLRDLFNNTTPNACSAIPRGKSVARVIRGPWGEDLP
jgi:hypothetical protein